jgi:hypothetical protein
MSVDTGAPILVDALDASGATLATSPWYYAGPVVLGCTASDATSGLDTLTYAGGTLVAGGVQADGNGNHTLSCTATDRAGNQSTASHAVHIDGTPPTVTLMCGGSPCAGGWYTGNVTLTAGATDTISGVAAGSALVSLDGGATWVASATLTDGVHTVQAKANDIAGNTGTASGTVRVDATAPSATILCNGSACGSGWYTGPVTVSLSATDATSGVAPGSALISSDGGATWFATATLTDGIHNIRGRATDVAGNPVTVNWVVQIDSAAPAVTGTLSGGVMGGSGWYLSGPVDLTCNATDTTSGVVAITYGTRTATANGITTLSCTATDHAGNSASYSTPVSIDRIGPSIQFLYSGNYCTGGWYNTPVGVSIAASDLFSSVTSLWFNVNGGQNVSSTTLSADGMYTLDGFATDLVGNTSHIGDSIQVDSTPPVSMWTTENNSWVGGKAALNGTSTDLMSGIAEIFVSTDNGATWVSIGKTSIWSITWDTKSTPPVPDGTYTILARADDNACNHEHTAKLIVNVDNTPPELKLQDSFNLLGRSTQIFNSDAGSGLDRAVATISGNRIEPVVITFSSPGNSEELSWDGKAGDGKVAPFGIYTVVVDAWDKVGNHSQTKGTWVRPAPQSPTTIPSTNNSSGVTNNPSATTVANSPSSTGISSQRALLPFWLLMLPMVGVVFWLLASGVAFTRDRRGVELRALGRSVNEYLSQSKINSKGGEEND